MNNRLIAWILTGLLALSGSARADEAVTEAELSRFHATKEAGLQAQIDSLNSAIELLQSRELTDREQFELIAEPSFSAYDTALAQQGHTVATFYEFADTYQSQIDEWLTAHSDAQSRVAALQAEYDSLIETLDQLNPAQTATD